MAYPAFCRPLRPALPWRQWSRQRGVSYALTARHNPITPPDTSYRRGNFAFTFSLRHFSYSVVSDFRHRPFQLAVALTPNTL
ncbi:hypothetical protein KCP76_25280 [Salmonella enterica subsp. enterica serovar Weltevreden]|nr:hypothetical protein KCP76_25280 [Salmonella enterica subsp. enterica serovar Weltevreden]